MKHLPQGYISTLISQKKLSGNGNSNNGNNATVSDDYNFNPSIKELPNSHIPDGTNRNDYGLPLSEISALLGRTAKRVYERHLARERGEELIAKADEYEIPYDASNIDFLDLQDKVEEFEEAITKANEYGIDWKNFGYDLLALEQEIMDLEEAECDYVSYAMGEYNLNRGVV